ncbi:ArsR/SmtB family transcription factor [Leptospira andrefontaineae]|uniref:ArsR family transcriptional regulator n=1 Tax=Leptospira andrefontaineae TaxID=2484976 RepID=A0A4V3JGL2_9LEPT|nr:metalloregulator ArsR/SmtB family transcription factor [Leptospira andrefontaineae]TGK43479.1 ArsR family transcriptional regulator [Leptospira andrefontaineae]
MGITKTELFNKRQNKIASYAKALGHPARIAILESILKRKACICGDLVDELGLAQATISQHLKALKEVGILQGTIDGSSVCYCINIKTWEEIGGYFGPLLTQIPESGNSC